MEFFFCSWRRKVARQPPSKKNKVPRSKIIRPLPATVERAAIKFLLWVKQSVSYSLASRYVRFSLKAVLSLRREQLGAKADVIHIVEYQTVGSRSLKQSNVFQIQAMGNRIDIC